MSERKKTYDDDDGRVIANMNVEGMPWYLDDAVRRRKNAKNGQESSSDFSDLTKGETWEIIKGTVKAGLMIGGVYFVVFLLFILFCVFIWFR